MDEHKSSKLARDFLQALYRGIDEGFLTLWTSGDKKTRWYTVKNMEKAISDSMLLKSRQNVYFGVGLRKERLNEWKRGTNKDILFLPGVWLEIDLKNGTHVSNNLPDYEEAKMILNTFPLSPSVVVHSGGGLHCYWLFDKAIQILTEKDRQNTERLLKQFQDVFIRLARAKGLHIDKTSDLARVLRVPGTFNLKSDPKPVVTLNQTDFRYSLLELRQAIEDMEKNLSSNRRTKKNFEDLEPDLPDAKVKPIIEGCNFIQSYLKNKESATYAEWMAALSIGAYCEGFEEICHSWSEGHPNYSEAETDKKINEIRSNMKPRTCAAIHEEFGACSGCIHFNKINSPIALGMRIQKPVKKIFQKTDLGNAEWLVYRHGENLRYCPPFGRWYVWKGTRWVEDQLNEVELLAKETVRHMYKEAFQIEDTDSRQALIKHALKSEAHSRITSMISLAKSEKGIPILPSQLDSDPWKLNCKNGTLDLKTGKLLPHNRKDLITKMVAVNYDPTAECPTWMSFLESIMKNEKGEVKYDLIDFLQKAVGYSLTGDTSEQVMFFLHGSGRNGKSTFINTIKELLGDYANQTNTETFMIRNSDRVNNDIAALKGARMVSAVESEEGKKLAESLIKQLTGGEAIQARFLRQEFFEYVPQFKIFFTTNHKPVISGTDVGIWRRIRLIPFTVTIPEEKKDTRLPEKLKAELPGILRWAVEGCLKWQKNGLGNPKEVVFATQNYKNEMDTLNNFLSECCSIGPSFKVTTKDLYSTYQRWSVENGEIPLNKKKFLIRLKEKMASEGYEFEQVRIGSNGDRGYQGIGLIAFL